jgi:hypothetical protein
VIQANHLQQQAQMAHSIPPSHQTNSDPGQWCSAVAVPAAVMPARGYAQRAGTNAQGCTMTQPQTKEPQPTKTAGRRTGVDQCWHDVCGAQCQTSNARQQRVLGCGPLRMGGMHLPKTHTRNLPTSLDARKANMRQTSKEHLWVQRDKKT